MKPNVQTKTIDGHSVSMTPFPFRRFLKLKAYLALKFGSSLGKIASGLSGTDEGAEINPMALGNLVESIISTIKDPNEIEDILFTILEGVAVDSQPIVTGDRSRDSQNLDDLFTGEYWFPYKLCGWVIQYHFLGNSGIGKSLADKMKTLVSQK